MSERDTVRAIARSTLLLLLVSGSVPALRAQDAGATSAAPTTAGTGARQVGTVTALANDLLTLATDKGESITVGLAPDTWVLQLPPGSTDLKAAQASTVAEIAIGDRVLITSAPATGSGPAIARRVVMMKSAAIAEQRETAQTGWAHSHGGTLSAVDGATGAITISSRGRTLTVATSATTIFRRYASDSARFKDAKRSSLAELHTGDQLRVRGEMTGSTIEAAEIVSGSFEQISGSVVAIDAAGSVMTLRNERTKKTVSVKLTAATEIHHLPPEMAAQFAARSKAVGHGGQHTPAAGGAQSAASTASGQPSGPPSNQHAEGDLGQAVAHLPDLSPADLKVGSAVLLIATGGAAPTAITVLSGVEPLLAAMESGGAETTLAPWSVSSGDSSGAASQ